MQKTMAAIKALVIKTNEQNYTVTYVPFKKRKCVKVLLLSVIHNVVREVISSISSGILSGPGCAEICAGRSKVLSSSRPHSKSYTLPE